MKISINAPSYKRPDGVDTLKYIPDCRIWVCETEADKYRKKNPEAEIIEVPKGIQGNLCRIRNYILDTENIRGIEAIVLIDDDLQRFGYHERKKTHRLESGQVWNMIRFYTDLAVQFGVKMWGMNINFDKQSYREYTPFSLVSYIGGPFSVHIKSPLRYDENLPLKEDYDMTLQHLNIYRRVLRINKFFYVVKQGGSGTATAQKGGCAVYRNIDREIEQLEALQRKWGANIVKYDKNDRSHSTNKKRTFDINPVIRVPISGV